MNEISTGAWIILATQIVTLISAGLAFAASLHNGKKIQDVKVTIDGRLDALIALNKLVDTAAGKAQGMVQGKAEGKAEEAAEQSVRDAIAEKPKSIL